LLDNVSVRLVEVKRGAKGRWTSREVKVPRLMEVTAVAIDRREGDEYELRVRGFTTPTTLYLAKGGRDNRERLKGLPAFFDATGLEVTQHQAVSKDGTKIPYFQVMRRDAARDGRNPTLLEGYGGFEISYTPFYSGVGGNGWLTRGGTWVIANIRGGGEFGPQWHRIAQREGRQKAHDDFAAVAEDLIRRNVTSPAKLGILGGSQGGLLVGATMLQRPELFGAVVSTVPLLDMKRYHKLPPGASWMGEYGDPDKPEDWAFIRTWSPYHLLRADAKYPTPFYWTNTKDDRVHPGHARKMVAKMESLGHPVYYFENTEGGHGSGAVNKQTAEVTALQYAYLWMMLR
jgi:prolyl oligopeptidase